MSGAFGIFAGVQGRGDLDFESTMSRGFDEKQFASTI
jgi:hypothetical protein